MGPTASGASEKGRTAEGMPHADEALKTKIERFEAHPDESFTELASALRARGHGAEALRICEHGLQLRPDSVAGRVERAACLLAVGRPKVAYVELRRALALEPRHRRALRLLGRSFKEAGAPARAAALLAERLSDAEAQAAPAETAVPTSDHEGTDVDANLFSNLTVDLGLGAAIPALASRPVATTQVIRRRGVPRPPRSESELAAIDGPIVETTQPGQIVETAAPEAATVESRALAPLFEVAEDEPLFPEASPFAVRPVTTGDLTEVTVNDEAHRTLVDIATLEEGAGDATEVHDAPPIPTPIERSSTEPDGIDARASSPPPRGGRPDSPSLKVPPAATTLPDLARPGRPDSAGGATDPVARVAPVGRTTPAIERVRRPGPRLVVVPSRPSGVQLLLGALGGLAVLLYVASLVTLGWDALLVWLS